MEFPEFVQLVKKMRELQVSYFKTKTTAALREAKDAERRVDAALRVIADGPKQPGLFDEGGES
jgi:hypothetical protein